MYNEGDFRLRAIFFLDFSEQESGRGGDFGVAWQGFGEYVLQECGRGCGWNNNVACSRWNIGFVVLGF